MPNNSYNLILIKFNDLNMRVAIEMDTMLNRSTSWSHQRCYTG